jgi:surface antigen/peptidoglycan hydrolase CwlO-like protein
MGQKKIKSMQKNRTSNRSFIDILRTTPVLVTLSCLALIMTATFGGFHVFAVTCNSASDCQQQIANNTNQLNSTKQNLGVLQNQASSYQDAINQLQDQISGLQAQIQTNQNTQASLQNQIIQSQQQLDQQKSNLSDDLRSLYVSGQITPIEMLATSQNISEYVDQQEAYTAVQNKIESTVQQIAALQVKLESQKTQVENLISTQQAQQSQLANTQAQQASLLSYNQDQQSQYNQQIVTTQQNISQLNARLSALNDAGSSTILSAGNCGGGYPGLAKGVNGNWGCTLPQDQYPDGTLILDSWGMENRECVSYTAFMASSKYGISTNNWGNAYQWISAAENNGYTVDQTPSVGAIAIRNRDYSVAGDVGHAMYVVAVNGPDSITVDEYNEHYNGQFDERTFQPSSYDSRGGLYYIHFQ